MPQNVAVIGAGPGGLASLKTALESGFDATAYEKDPGFGGIWNFTEDPTRNCGALCTVTNTTKHVMCFSDFPMSKTCPNYLTLNGYQAYLESYVERFDLEKRIRYNEEVIKVEKCGDFDSTGRWEVHSRKTGEEGVKVAVYDFVMVASGIFTEPFIPTFVGADSFNGKIIHSQRYKTFKGFEGKRVLVVGLGNTAGDIACELSRHTSQVYISTRNGSWVMSRLQKGGIPLDLQSSRLINDLPEVVFNWFFGRVVKSGYNLANFGLETNDHPTRRFPIINDELPHRIVTGSVIIKAEVDKLQGDKVFFKDNTTLDDIDTIICATGFDVEFPFLSNSWLQAHNDYIPLYKYVFPPELPKLTLAIIGAFRANGPVPPVCEMQARWAIEVFLGKCQLPSKEDMLQDIQNVQKNLTSSFPSSRQYFHRIKSPAKYMDDIGSLIGARPDLLKLVFQDPALAFRCYFKSWIPAHYRLMGPGAWSGAKNVINEVEESYLTPMRTRIVKTNADKSNGVFYLFACAVFVALIAYIFYR